MTDKGVRTHRALSEESAATADLVAMVVSTTQVSCTANTVTLAYATPAEAQEHAASVRAAQEVFG